MELAHFPFDLIVKNLNAERFYFNKHLRKQCKGIKIEKRLQKIT